MKKRVILVLIVMAYLATLYVNYLAGTGVLNDVSSADVSEFYPTMFTPAGFTFSIWGIIYLFNLCFILIQVYKLAKHPQSFNKRLNIAYMLVCAFNVLWLYCWHYQLILLSVIIMIGILLALIFAVVSTSRSKPKSTVNYLEFINFSLYLGWISVATIANISAYLYQLGLTPSNPANITLLVMFVAVSLAIWQNYRLKNYWYGLVIIWAFYGIYAARSTDFSDGANTVMIAALIGIAMVMVSSFYHLSRKLSK